MLKHCFTTLLDIVNNNLLPWQKGGFLTSPDDKVSRLHRVTNN